MPRQVSVVPHTHWDREWYLPFERFRLRLVELLDDLLPRLHDDTAFAHFLLDGQMAVVDDDTALRPHHAEMIRTLVAAGRLSIGPWYTLPDEFLVSGETLVRDLQLGRRRAEAFGGAMDVGYLPDMFGHVAQMPQILRQLGFEHAVVWRGVPAAIDRTGFWWSALDGSTVRAEYLPTGYGNGAHSPDDPKSLLARIRRWEAEHAAFLADGPLLWMNGSDHTVPEAWLGRVVAEADALAGGDLHLTVRSLRDHLEAAPTAGLPSWRGELRSGARANVLMGVVSNRVDVRGAAARAETALEQQAEPLAALFVPAAAWPEAELDAAWLHVIRNAAHDSVSACSADEVVDAVLERYASATAIAGGLVERALGAIAGTAPAGATVVVNTSAWPRGGVVELTLPGDDVPAHTELVEQLPADEALWTVTAADAPSIVAEVAACHDGGYEVRGDGDALEVVLREGPVPEGDAGALADLARRSPRAPVRILRRRHHAVRLLAAVEAVPGFGWSVAVPTAHPAVAVAPDAATMTNGFVTVAVDRSDGTFSLDGHAGLGRLVDGGDAGDTYNWCPPDDDVEIDRPDGVTVSVLSYGPVRAALRIEARYRWPASSTPTRRAEDLTTAAVVTTLTLDAGARHVAVAVEIDNPCRDHRLRAWFPLPEPASHSTAATAFGIVRRGLVAEGGPTERALATYPSGRFVRAGDLTIAPDRQLEYELVDVRDEHAGALALTLLRASRMLSRGPMSSRPLPAGPELELEGSQVLGRLIVRYALACGPVDPYQLADEVTVPLLVTTGAGAATAPRQQQRLEVAGARVSSVRRDAARRLEVRVFNPSDEPTTVGIGHRTGRHVDLRGTALDPIEGEFALGPWAIATFIVDQG